MADSTNTNQQDAAAIPSSQTTSDLLGGAQGKSGTTAVKYPSEQTDINSILEPYVNQLMQLGPEYQKEMNYLAPYLSGQVTDNQLAPAPAYTGPDASTVNEGQESLNQADNALGTAVEDQTAPGFGQETSAAKQYENTILPSAGIQSGLAYQKYLETYGGMQADESNWTQEQKDAYAAIVGDTSSTGLPSVTDENAANNATNTADQVQQQITSSANASTAGGGNIQ
jgi:hypothetical protein